MIRLRTAVHQGFLQGQGVPLHRNRAPAGHLMLNGKDVCEHLFTKDGSFTLPIASQLWQTRQTQLRCQASNLQPLRSRSQHQLLKRRTDCQQGRSRQQRTCTRKRRTGQPRGEMQLGASRRGTPSSRGSCAHASAKTRGSSEHNSSGR